ncbi:putative site specific recombinase [Pseudomonas syringae pv. rhaphiolepidis]|nr:putative site specific recombinase [Pseudomonas syringae pv. rhaphiolepidis]KWS45477.1 hypothetical protein AL060_12425 [Pseudomonas syringae pv. rhaphiolepidis]
MPPIFGVRTVVLSNGERYSLVVDKRSGLPLYSPNLFLTCRVRNTSQSHASIAANAGCLVVLLRFCVESDIDLADRFARCIYLSRHEIDSLRDFCTFNFSKWAGYEEIPIYPLKQLNREKRRVAKTTIYRRLTVIASFLKWYAMQLIPMHQREQDDIKEMVSALLHSRPIPKSRNSGLVDRALSAEQVACLLDVIEPDSLNNPFSLSVRRRNRLMVLLEYELGIRGGELLNIRIEDFDFSNNTLLIVRRADQYDDTRVRQPLVKTQDRQLIVSDWMISEIHNYLITDRNRVPNSKKCAYLFITYKYGPTQGKAFSVTAYTKMWHTIQQHRPLLKDVTAHRLRHTWNYRFSKLMDSEHFDLTESEQEAIRSVLMGWKQGSGTARLYNKRFVEKVAFEAGLKLQKIAMRGVNL